MDRWPNRSFPSEISLVLWLTSRSLLSPTYKIQRLDIFMGTAQDIGSQCGSCCSLFQASSSVNFILHNILKLLSVVGVYWSVTYITEAMYFAGYSHFYLVKTSFFLLLSYTLRAVTKQCMITFILSHTDNISERMLSHLHN